jgi:hypothetical protein
MLYENLNMHDFKLPFRILRIYDYTKIALSYFLSDRKMQAYVDPGVIALSL